MLFVQRGTDSPIFFPPEGSHFIALVYIIFSGFFNSYFLWIGPALENAELVPLSQASNVHDWCVGTGWYLC